MDRSDPAVNWLLRSKDPSVRYFTLTELLHESEESKEVQNAKSKIVNGSRIRALLGGQKTGGGFGVYPYRKWTGAHWRLVSCVELGVTKDNKGVQKAAETILVWLDRTRPPKIAGLWRAHASMEGNALGVCSRLGLADDPRVKRLAERIVEWQWPDGGWNCDPRKEADHSSFYESLVPLWGLIEYSRETKDQDTSKTAERAAEFFLKHQLFRSCKTGQIINPEWLKLHFPLYWHFDILQGLRVLQLAEKLNDPRVKEALDIIESKRLKAGSWGSEGYYWVPRGRTSTGKKRISSVEVVDWGRGGPNDMITLNALRVLKGSSRLK